MFWKEVLLERLILVPSQKYNEMKEKGTFKIEF